MIDKTMGVRVQRGYMAVSAAGGGQEAETRDDLKKNKCTRDTTRHLRQMLNHISPSGLGSV